MSLIRPKPRHADDVSDAFEQLFSASPMSKLLSVESGCNANNSNLNMVTPSSFKLPVMVTPVAKIFLQLKKSEGNVSVDSVGHSRRGNNKFCSSNTDSDSSRLSLEQQPQADVAQHREPLHFSTNSYFGSQPLGQGGYTNCDERPGTDTGGEYMVLRSPRVCLQRLDENVEENEESVMKGQGSLYEIEEERSADKVVQGEEGKMGFYLEQNSEIVELGSEEKMMSRYDLEENEEADDQAEPRKHRPSKQTRKHPLTENVHRCVRIRKKKARVLNRRRNRSFFPEESESSDAENERRRPEPRRRRHHLEKQRDDAKDKAVARDSDERGENGCDGNVDSEERQRWQSHENDLYDECEANRWTTGAHIGGRQHFTGDESDKQDTGPRDTCNSKNRKDSDRTTSEEEEVRNQPSEEDWECDDDNRSVPRMSRQKLAATDVTHPQSATYSENKSNKEFVRKGTTKQIANRSSKTSNHRRRQSSHRICNEPADDDMNVTREAVSFPQENDSKHVQSALIPITTNEESKRPDKENMTEKTVAVSCDTPPFRRVTRIMSANRHVALQDKSRKLEDRINAKTDSVDEARPVDRQEARPVDRQEARPVDRQEARPVDRQEARPVDRQEARPVDRQEARPVDRQEARPVDRQEARPVDRQEAKKKTTAVPDLGETPVNSRKLLKVSAVRQHTLDDWTIIPLGRNIIVDGHRPDDPVNQLWHSNAIVKRISSHAVCTVSGTVYTLRGKMVEEKAFAEGFSKKVVAAFKKGFPPTWKEIIQEYHESIRCKRSSKTRPSKMNTPVDQSKMNTPVEQSKMKPTRKPNTHPLRRPSVMASPEMPVTISSLPKTRSGRHVIPQLAWWTGQRVTIDPNHQTIVIVPGTPDTQCATISSVRWHNNQKADTNHDSQQNRKSVTKEGKQEVTGPRRRRGEVNKSGHGKNGKDSQKRRHNLNADRRKDALYSPTRKLQQRQKESSDVNNSETEALTNTPIQRLFSEHTVEINSENVADIDDTNDRQSPQLMDTVNRQQGASEDLVKTLLFLERHERTGVNAPVRAAAADMPQVRRGDSPGDEASSYVSDSTNNSLGYEESTGNSVCQLDYLNGVGTATEATSSKANAGASLGKNRQATSGCVANLTRDILRIVKANKRTTAKQRVAGKALSCYSPRDDSTVGDSSGSMSDNGATNVRNLDAGDVGHERHNNIDTRNNLTALVETPRQRENTLPLRRLNIQNRHADNMMPLDILQTQERVDRCSALSDAARNMPVLRFKENMTDDILCRSVEHKRLFSGKDVGVRRHSDKHLQPRAQGNGRSDKSKAVPNGKDRTNVGLCGKERNTKSTEARVKQKNVRMHRNQNGKFYSPAKKDALLPRSKEQVSSTRPVSSDNSEGELVTIKREVLSQQKAQKAREKTKRKTAAAPSDKPGKLFGNFVGGVGTLKRKRQLREFVEQHECGYENDLFDSTPFQQHKIRKVTTGNEAVDDFFNVTAGRMSFTTPGATPSSSVCNAWLPISDKKTPSSSMAASPLMSESVNRNAVDRYVNRLKRVAKRRATKLVSGAVVTASHGVPGPRRQRGETLASVSPSVFQMANRSDNVDSSYTDDYYFSDGSDSR